ncbi:hypothetical protein O7600_02320 [Micromonospora sp. WMMA1998]|uniref:hypothetical protein n=1 Tax=Micromonospora sp. WMMA1998 TaxID=3015167 RepID=UPI00248C627D|nr:hypothetical protein [Micromonospora sp. WMMA1998]WBC15692.1 hypothetical protein O7600_02320 [Micromonospora sp. WMMA1998]
MSAEVWTAVTSLGGVAIGGGLSYLVQHSTQRTAARAEQRRQELARTESRRAERLALVERFVGVAAEAERWAFTRPDRWSDGEKWPTRTREVMNRFWVAERMVRLLFPVAEADPAAPAAQPTARPGHHQLVEAGRPRAPYPDLVVGVRGTNSRWAQLARGAYMMTATPTRQMAAPTRS